MPRPRKPTVILEAIGAFDKDPQRRTQREHEPQAEGRPQKPKFLKGATSRVWDRLLAEVEKLEVAKSADSVEFSILCCLVADFEENPSRIPVGKLELMRKLLTTFGLDPATRARLKTERR